MKEMRPISKHSNGGKVDQPVRESNGATGRITLNPHAILRVLAGIALFLLFCHVTLQLTSFLTGHPSIYGLVHLFNLDAEDNLPSAFSTLLLLLSSLLLTVIARLKWNQAMVGYWVVLAVGFMLMAADEEFSFHEELIEPVRAILGTSNLGIFYFAWVLPAIALVTIIGLSFLKFLIRLPRKTASRFIVAGALYVGGCIGMELAGGRYDELHGQDNLTYIGIATSEESLEMLGVIVFIWSLLDYMTDTFGEVEIELKRKADKRKH